MEAVVLRKFDMNFMEAVDNDDRVILRFLNYMIDDLGFIFPPYEYEFSDRRTLLVDPNFFYGQFFLAKKLKKSKKDGSGSYYGRWSTFGGDKLIKTLSGKVLGFKKLLKFIPEDTTDAEIERGDEWFWLMEEYRVHKKFKQDKVVCRLRLVYGSHLDSLHRAHIRGC